MTLVIAFGLVVLAAVIGVWLLGTRGRDDRSMKTHKQTVGTIERIVGRSGVDAGDPSNHVRLVGDRPKHSRGDHVAGGRYPVGLSVNVEDAGTARKPTDATRPAVVPPAEVPVDVARPEVDSEMLDQSSPPAWRPIHARSRGRVAALIPAAAGAGVVIAAIVVGATVVSSSSKPAARPVVPSSVPTARGGVGGASATSAPSTTTTTTTPSPTTTVVGAVTQTAAGYEYQVAGKVVSAVLSTSGSCWVEVRDGSANGPAVFEATLTSGSTKTFSAPGGLWLRLGAPRSVQLSLQGQSVALPAVGGPYDITVVPSAAG